MSDFSLYKVSHDFENLIDLIDRGVLEQWEEDELIKKIKYAISSQGDDIVKYYVNQMAQIETLKNEINRLRIIKSSKEAALEKLKDKLSTNMRTLRCKKIETPLGNITLALDSVTEKVEIDEANINYDTIPEEYVKTSKEIRTNDIKKAIKSGLQFEGVKIVTTPAKAVFRLGQESKDYIAESRE